MSLMALLTGSVPLGAASTLKETLGTSAANIDLGATSDAAYVISLHTAAATYTLTRIDIQMLRIGTGTAGNVTGGIYADSFGSPGSLLASSTNTIVSSDVATTEGPITFSFSGLSVASGTSYWFGASDSTVSGVNSYRIRAGALATGTTNKSADGLTWAALGTRKLNMFLYGY